MQLALTNKQSWMHGVNPSLKLLIMLLVFIGIMFIHNVDVIAYVTLLFLLVFLASIRYPVKIKVILLLPILFIFLTSSLAMIMFGKGDTTWLRFGLIHVTEESFFRGVHLGLRSMVFAFCGLLFALTTKPVLLFYSLMQQGKLPPRFAYGFMAGVRLLPIMVEEYLTLRNALLVRGVEQKKGLSALIYKIKLFSIPLLSQSIRRAHRVAVAMEAKRFSRQKERTYYYRTGFSKKDIWFVTLFISMFMVGFAAATYLPIFSISDVRYK
ncbi:MAG: energy-coupling factor transporter transmembrane component T family protein [Bacillota bacterium]